MAEVCGKHDVVKVNGKCWCCEIKQQDKPAQSKPTPVATGGK
jgi:hypothetical protein